MTRRVSREEILDYVTYNERRDQIRREVMALKERRRIHCGPHLTFLFENADTMRYQIQEMMRIEEIVKEADIEHEIKTYNEVLGDHEELGCTLLIEIDSEAERAEKLTAWLDLPSHIYARLEDGRKVYCIYDARQVGEDRLSSVQYLKFDVRGEAPIAVGTDFEQYDYETTLTDAQRAALAEDLAA